MNDRVEYVRSEGIPGLVLSEARLARFRFERHFHLDYHIGLVTDGVQKQRLHGENVLLAPGSIQLMPPGEIHDGVSANDQFYTLKTFRVSPELMDVTRAEIAEGAPLPSLSAAVFQDVRLAGELLRLHDAIRQPDHVGGMCQQSAWLALLDRLLTLARTGEAPAETGRLSRLQWCRVKEFCDAQLATKITLEQLATLCGLDRFRFLKVFKQTVGMTPHAWLIRLRLERACELLGRGCRPVTEVAHAVGFYDHAHFCRAFRDAFGVPPSRY
jgi:AraC-like DNA-binding protein